MDTPTVKFGDHMEFIKQASTITTTFFLLILSILIFIYNSFKKCKNDGRRNIGRNTESHIPVVSLFEYFSTLRRHHYGILPTSGYLLEKYNGAFRLNIGIYKIVVVSRPSIIEKLSLSPNTGHLHKPKEYNKSAIRFLKDTLFTLRAEPWKVHRSVLARAFTYNSLQEHVKIFEEHAKNLVFAVDQSVFQQEFEQSNSCSRLDFGKAVASHVLYIILHIATGRSIVGDHVETSRFCYLIDKLRQLSLYRSERPWMLLDLLWFFHPVKWEMERVREELESVFVKALKTARKEVSIEDNCDQDMAGKSLIYLMIKAGFSDDKIFRELFMFIIVEKCRMEIDQMFAKLNARNVDMNIELLGELNYLEQCISETIRLYPGILAPGRMLESPLILDESTTIAAGTRVYMSVFHLHRDPQYYPEPEMFDPERFSPQNVLKRGKCEYVGFSKGPRDCIGKKSAIMELKVLASYILYNFEAYTNNSREKFEAEIGPNRWPVPDPKIELRRRS